MEGHCVGVSAAASAGVYGVCGGLERGDRLFAVLAIADERADRFEEVGDRVEGFFGGGEEGGEDENPDEGIGRGEGDVGGDGGLGGIDGDCGSGGLHGVDLSALG